MYIPIYGVIRYGIFHSNIRYEIFHSKYEIYLKMIFSCLTHYKHVHVNTVKLIYIALRNLVHHVNNEVCGMSKPLFLYLY